MTGFPSPLRAVLIAILMVGIAGLGEGRASSALFTARATNPGNTFQAGTLRMSNSRSGQAVFTTTGSANGAATSTMSVVGAAGSAAYLPGPVGGSVADPLPTDPGFKLAGTGGVIPGMLLVNAVTIGNVGSLSAGEVNLSIPSITVANDAAAHCDASNALFENDTDVCGRGRLTDVMRLVAFYRTGDGKAVCVVGNQPYGKVVTAADDGQALMGCGASAASLASPSFGVTFGIPITRNANGVTGGRFALAASTASFTFTPSASGDRIDPALAAVPVWNYRNGSIMRDWGPGETRAITFGLFIDSTADNRYQGARATVDLRWDSTSLSGAPTAGTGSVSGTLTGTTGAIANQQVGLSAPGGTTTYVTTDANGAFSFANVASGTYGVVAHVGDVPVAKPVTVAGAQASTVSLVAGAINRTVTVTLSPAPTEASPWTAHMAVPTSAGNFKAWFSGPLDKVTSSTSTTKYRSDDAANSTLILYAAAPGQWSPTTVQYARALSDSPSTLSVTVPTVTVSAFACASNQCTATLGVSGAPLGAKVDAYLAASASMDARANPATMQGHAAGESISLTFGKPAAGSYVIQIDVYPDTTPGASPSAPWWSWLIRTTTALSVTAS